MNYILAIATIAILSGCATEAGLRRKLDNYVGKPVSVLVAKAGVPTGTYETGGKKFVSYHVDQGAAIVNHGYVATAHKRSCTVTFAVSSEEIVESYTYTGNTCRDY